MNITTPYLTEKDKKDLVWSITHNLPVVVLSHVSHAQNVLDVKKYLIDSGSKGTKVFFKIQNVDSIIHFKEIIDIAD
jgi:pyruvate kinase